MPFTPPLFSKFGKKSDDLFSKQYNFKSFELTSKRKTAGGYTFETAADLHGKGSIKTKTKIADVGEAEFTLATSCCGNKGKIKFTELADGLTVTLNGTNKKSPAIGLEAEYGQDFFSGSFGFKSGLPFNPSLSGSATMGMNGLSVGGDASYCGGAFKWDVGVQYEQSDFAATLQNTSNGDNIEFGYFHKVSSDYSLASKYIQNADGKTKLMGGFEYNLDGNTTVKGKSVFPCKVLSLNVEHKLASPQAKFGVSASFLDGKNGLESKDFGVNLTLGDY